MSAATACETAGGAADMTPFSSGVAAIHCEPWDIGTGVTGYAWRAPNPRAVLLLQHGYGHYAQQYLRGNAALVSHLLAMGVSVYAFDMWGNGWSLGQRGATDVDRAVTDHLAARRKVTEDPETRGLPVFLFGHSVGGLVTVTSILRDGVNVQGVILASPTLADASGFSRAMARLGAVLAPATNIPGPGGKIESLTGAPEIQQALIRDTLYFRRVTWITAASGASLAHANWTLYPSVRAPVLVLHGDADETTSADASRRFVDAIGSTDKTLRLVPRGLHVLLDDTKRDEVRSALLAWIEARIPSASTAAAR
jgi:acylglycerol lipase